MGGYCVVSGCKNSGGHAFPKNEKLRKAWIARVQREASWHPTSHSRVCTDHFLPSDYVSTNFYGNKCLKKQLKKGAVPSVFWWKLPCPEKADRDHQREKRRDRRQEGIAFEEELQRRIDSVNPANEVDTWIQEFQQRDHIPEAVAYECVETTQIVAEPTSEAVGNQEDSVMDCDIQTVTDCQSVTVTVTDCQTVHPEKSTQCDFRAAYFDIGALKKPSDLQVLTGLSNIEQFSLLLSMCDPVYRRQMAKKKRCSPHSLSFANMLVMTLTKLRHNMTCELLGTMFDVSPTKAAEIFRSTIKLMHDVLRKISLWPEKHDPQLPVVIIDCTELKISRPSNLTLQSLTYSTYKSTNTVKILIGITPKGSISFVSDAFSGSASDQQVFERSGLLDLLCEGDIVLADRGFNIQHHVASKGVRIVTPAFLKGRSQLLPAEVTRSRMITRQRIHVERLIGLTKTYKFVKGPIHYKHVSIISEAYFVACFLSNIKPAIVK